MANLLIFIIAILVFEFSFCNINKNIIPIQIISNLSKNKYSTIVDSLTFNNSEIDKTLSIYIKSRFFKNFIYNLNFIYNKIDIFNCETAKYVKSIYLDSTEPSKISNIQDFIILDKNKILIQSRDFIFIIDSIGQINDKINISSRSSKFRGANFDDYRIESKDLNTNLASENDQIYAFVYDIKYGFCDKRHYSSPLIANFNLSNLKFEILPVTYSHFYKDNYYGFHTNASITTNNNDVIYNFPISNEIYSYNTVTKQLKTIISKNEILEPLINNISWNNCNNADAMLKHFTNNSYYGSIIFDHYSNLYYRFENKLIAPQIFSPYITVFNINWEMIKTYKILKNEITFNGYFINSNGLYLPMISNIENTLKYLNLKFIPAN